MVLPTFSFECRIKRKSPRAMFICEECLSEEKRAEGSRRLLQEGVEAGSYPSMLAAKDPPVSS